MAKGLTVKVRADASQFDKTMRGVRAGLRSAAGPMKALGVTAAAAGAAIVGAGVAAGVLVKKFIEIGEGANTANARTANAIKQMGVFGDRSGEVANRLEEVATATALQTGIDRKSIQMTQAKLATFKELLKSADQQEGVFDRVTMAAINLAAAGFGTAEENATQLGKAFSDVEAGLTALKRSGTLTREEIESISQEFARTGDQSKAFERVLAALEVQSKNSATTTADGTKRISTAFQIMKEEIGKPIAEEFEKYAEMIVAETPEIVESIRAMSDKIAEIAKAVFSTIADTLQGDTTKIVAIGEFLGSAFGRAFKIGARSALHGVGSTMFKGLDAAENFIRETTGLDKIMGKSNLGERSSQSNALITRYHTQILGNEISREFAALMQTLQYDPNYRLQTEGGTFRQARPGEASMFSDASGRALIKIQEGIERISRNTDPSLFPSR